MRVALSFAVLLCLIGCGMPEHASHVRTPDTIVISKPITDEIAGPAYRKRATSYFVVAGKDTSAFMPVFSESAEGGRVGLDLNIDRPGNDISYRQLMEELRRILPEAAKDYDPDSLDGMYLGGLIVTGDLAVRVMQQYEAAGGKREIATYGEIRTFLLHSQLGTDFNALFKPYSLVVEEVAVEKVFFASRDALFHYAKIETDTSDIPDQILDCMVYIKLKKE